MVVTHLFQILGFIAMEPPTALAPDPISEEKNKVFRSLMPIDPADVVRGQYVGYREEKGVAPDSGHRDLRRAQVRDRQLALGGRALLPAHRQAHGAGPADHLDRLQGAAAQHVSRGFGRRRQGPDHLTFDLADPSRLSLSFYGKKPGPGMRLAKQSLQFALHETGEVADVLEAYERLILDAMRGDHTLFSTADGIERLWEISTRLLENPPPVRIYAPGSWGPKAIHQLIAPHAWRLPFERAWREPDEFGA